MIIAIYLYSFTTSIQNVSDEYFNIRTKCGDPCRSGLLLVIGKNEEIIWNMKSHDCIIARYYIFGFWLQVFFQPSLFFFSVFVMWRDYLVCCLQVFIALKIRVFIYFAIVLSHILSICFHGIPFACSLCALASVHVLLYIHGFAFTTFRTPISAHSYTHVVFFDYFPWFFILFAICVCVFRRGKAVLNSIPFNASQFH